MNNINLQYVVNYFDYDRNQVFDFNEFAQFILALDRRANSNLVNQLFNALSSNKQYVSLNEMNSLLS